MNRKVVLLTGQVPIRNKEALLHLTQHFIVLVVALARLRIQIFALSLGKLLLRVQIVVDRGVLRKGCTPRDNPRRLLILEVVSDPHAGNDRPIVLFE